MNLQVDKVTIDLGIIGITTTGDVSYTIPDVIRRGWLRTGNIKIYIANWEIKDEKRLIFDGFTTGELGWNQGVLSIECMSILDKMNNIFPNKIYSEFCQHKLYDAFCFAGRADSKDDWMSSGTVEEYAGPAMRGIFAGGINISTYYNVIEYIAILTLSDTSDFGDLSSAKKEMGAGSNASLGVFAGGRETGEVKLDTIDLITISTPSNTSDFGNLTVAKTFLTGVSDSTYVIFAGGIIVGDTNVKTLEKITTAATPLSNAVSFGLLTALKAKLTSASSGTKGYIAGGYIAANTNVIETVDFSALSDSVSFGTLSANKRELAAVGSSTNIVFAGGYTTIGVKVIEYITTAFGGVASNFGTLSTETYALSATDNKYRGIFAGGLTPDTKVMEYINIQAVPTILSVSFGNLVVEKDSMASGICSGN